MEIKAAVDSGVLCTLRKRDGVVRTFRVQPKSSSKRAMDNRDEYKLAKFVRSNQGTCMNQRPIVIQGRCRLKKDEVIADGPSTSGGEIALGKNPLIGFHDMGRLQLRGCCSS